MADFGNTLAPVFYSFDGLTYAMMAIVVVGAAFMMPNMSAIVTTTVTALAIFALAVFSRGVLGAGDARVLAREEWMNLLTMQLHTLLVYAAVFAFAISTVHAIRSLANR